MLVVAKNLSVLQLFISRMPKMCAILQLVSAPLNPIPIAEHFRRSHSQCEHSYGQHIYMSKENIYNIITITLKKGFEDLKQANILYFVLKPLYKKSIQVE